MYHVELKKIYILQQHKIYSLMLKSKTILGINVHTHTIMQT